MKKKFLSAILSGLLAVSLLAQTGAGVYAAENTNVEASETTEGVSGNNDGSGDGSDQSGLSDGGNAQSAADAAGDPNSLPGAADGNDQNGLPDSSDQNGLTDGSEQNGLPGAADGSEQNGLPAASDAQNAGTDSKTGPAKAPAKAPEAGADEEPSYVFNTYWKNAPTAQLTYTNEGFTADDPATQKDLQLRPTTNNLVTTTMQLSLSLQGSEDVKYPAGSIKIEVPAGYYEGWDESDPLNTAVNDSFQRLDQLYWMIPKAPETNTLSTFNYNIVKKEVNGKTETFYELTNYATLTGGTEFLTEIAYRLRPTMLKVTDTTDADGNAVGAYSKALPITLNIDKDMDGEAEASQSVDLSVDVQTKVNQTKITLTHSQVDANKGVFYNWDTAWGPKPADADQYFYIVWYAALRRGAGSTQPFNYVLHIDESRADGGELIGARKFTGNGSLDGYEQPGVVTARMDSSYSGIANSTSVVGQTWRGIMDNPVNNNIYNLDFCTGRTENLNSNWLDQGFALLYRYPVSKVKEAEEAGIDLVNDGLEVDNGVSVTEYWRDGHEVTYNYGPSGDLAVKRLPSLGGGIGIDKYRVNGNVANSQWYQLQGLQSLVAQGNDAPLIAKNINYSFVWNSDTAASTYQWNAEEGTYTTNGSSAEITDDPLTLMTDINNRIYPYGKAPSADISAAEPVTLGDGDYYYRTFYVTGSEYDITYSDTLGWQKQPRASTDYAKYEPIEIWTRAAGSGEWTHFGDVTRDAKGQYVFANAETGATQIVNSGRKVAFPENTAQIKAKHHSDFYESQFQVVYDVTLRSTPTVVDKLNADIASGERTYVGSFANAVWKAGDAVVSDGPVGRYWHRVGYEMSALSSGVSLQKQSSNLKNDPVKAEEVKDVSVDFYNSCVTPNGFNNAKYLKNYMFTSGIFYDLLPAGTYVNENEIVIGTREGPGTGIGREKITSGYTIELIDNWEGSGQTMLKITFEVPDDTTHKTWHDYWYGARLNYKLHNPYTNIVDRGTSPVNTVGFVNTSADNVIFNTNANLGSYDKLRIDKKGFYKNLITDANAQGYEVALAQAVITYNPVTVLEAAFTNRVMTDTNTMYEKSNTAYLGDNYEYRLQYTAASNTRTDNMVIYDVLDHDSDKTGDLTWVDISSIEAKKTYDPNNANTTDTCAPVLYYATVIPTADQMDVDNAEIWTTYAPADLSTVKAVAIDCRKTDQGNNFVLDQSGTLAAYLHFKATEDKALAERVNDNEAVMKARLFTGKTAGETAVSREIEAKSQLHLIKSELTISKASDPETGTKAAPTEIGNKPEIPLTYTLTIENETDETYPGILGVAVKDTLPDGLSVDASRTTTVTSDVLELTDAEIGGSGIVMGVSGQDLTFNLPRYANGSIEIKIPVIRAEGVHETTTYDNEAQIVKAGNVTYDDSDDNHKIIRSETTYHISTAHTLTVQPEGGSWNGEAADAVIPLYDTEVKNIPDPVREGYTFTGWEVVKGDDRENSGMSSLEPADNTFTMAETDTVIKALWEINYYTVTVTKTFSGIDALPDGFKITNNYDSKTSFTTKSAESGDGSEASPYTWTMKVPYHTNLTFTETGYQDADYSVTTDVAKDGADGSVTAVSGTIVVPANDDAAVAFNNVYSHTSYEVTKDWEGEGSYLDDFIPDELKIELYADGTKVKETTLNEANNWTYEWETLPDLKADGSGAAISYTVKEVLNSKAFNAGEPVTTDLTDAAGNKTGTSAAFTNTLKTIDVTAVKTWQDQENRFEIRPDSISIHLMQNGTAIEDANVTPAEDGTWTYKFEDVPQCDENGKDFTYTVTEDEVKGYNTSTDGMSVINTMKTVDVTVEKTWEDRDDAYGLRPETIHLTLMKNGEAFEGSAIDLGKDGNVWSYTFEDLPLEDMDGNTYTYTVEEDAVTAYDTEIDNSQNTLLTIKNTLKTRDITVDKIWEDEDNKNNHRPEEITVNLLRNGEQFDAETITDDGEGNWTAEFPGVPVMDADGSEYEYTVIEDAVTGYFTQIDGFTITNTICTPVLNDPPVKKVITGDKPSKDAEFTFTLKALDTTAEGVEELPMPEGSEGQTKTKVVTGAGEYEFGNIEFTMPGTYRYEITEKNTGEANYTYDDAVYEITYEVTQVDDHLECVRTMTRNGENTDDVVFTNKYTAPEPEIIPVPAGNKTNKTSKVLTGDISNSDKYLMLLMLAAGALLVLLFAKRRRNR